MQESILKLIKKDQLKSTSKKDSLERFVDEEVLRIIRTSSTYKYIKQSKQEDLSDVTLTLVCGHLFCYLRSKYRKQRAFTQKDLCDIIILAVKQIKSKSRSN